MTATKGIIDAKPKDLSSNVPLAKVLEVSDFLNAPVIANRYQWDCVFPDGDIIKYGVGGQGLYISPANDTVVAWFCTSDGSNHEGTMARSIVKRLSQ